MAIRWILAVAFLLAGLWLGNVALYNWFAAGGAATPSPGAYATRAYIYFGLTGLSFAGFVAMVVRNIRRPGK